MGAGVAGVCVLVWLAALSFYDVRDRRLPNWLTIPGAIAILAVTAAVGRGVPALAGAAVLFAVYLAVHLAAPTAMGAGDVKLAIGIGAMTGAFGVDVWAVSAVAAPVFTACGALVVVLCHAGSTVPHGPSMCFAAIVGCTLAVV